MTTESYNLMKMWDDMNDGKDYKRFGGSETYKVLRAWYLGCYGEGTAVNKLVALGAIKKVERVKFKELVLW